jgi:tryptophan 2,3-dioxygenase
MTPPEYTAIRPYLGQSSGFQSYQYRCVEYPSGAIIGVLCREGGQSLA